MTLLDELVARIHAIEHGHPAPALALHRLWPRRVPTPTHGHHLTDRDLHAIDVLVQAIERKIPR